MPIESVSRVLGHTNIKTTQIYAKITTQKLGNDLTAFGNQLNQTFGNIKVAGYETDNNHDGRVRQDCRAVRYRQRVDERNGAGKAV